MLLDILRMCYPVSRNEGSWPAWVLLLRDLLAAVVEVGAPGPAWVRSSGQLPSGLVVCGLLGPSKLL